MSHQNITEMENSPNKQTYLKGRLTIVYNNEFDHIWQKRGIHAVHYYSDYKLNFVCVVSVNIIISVDMNRNNDLWDLNTT